jgi:uncharacterized protein YrrD
MKSFAHEIHGMPVHATDGEIGTIQDVLFDPTAGPCAISKCRPAGSSAATC